MLFLGRTPLVYSTGVKTHYKEYTIFTYKNADYLCEPYAVKKNDWLYKIFRQKGEISASDFPKFLKIFQKLNPKLSNIDDIAAGIQIMIPLKPVDKNDYVQKEQGIVEVPVLEFSLNLKRTKIEDFIRKHQVESGDTVSTLLGKEFLQKDGEVSEIGEKTFTSLNPDIRDINRIYVGAHVLVPEPEILSQPWLQTMLIQGQTGNIRQPLDQAAIPPPPARPLSILSPGDLSRLKRYAQLTQGTLRHEGKVFFPGKKGQPARILDLSRTPVLEQPSGQRTLILPANTPVEAMDQDLVTAMKAYWKGIRLRELNRALSEKNDVHIENMNQRPRSIDLLIKNLMAVTPFDYTAQSKIPIMLKKIEMTVSLGRVTHHNRPDILINTGNVYGQALAVLELQGYDIAALSQNDSFGEITQLLFDKLGYDAWKNPGFYTEERVETIHGIYVSKGAEKHFITRTHPSESARTFLDNENIHLLMLDKDTGL